MVGEQHWLTDQQFLDAVAVAMITPRPVVITVAFIGYLVAGPIGGSLAALLKWKNISEPLAIVDASLIGLAITGMAAQRRRER